MKKSLTRKLSVLILVSLLILPSFTFAETGEPPQFTEASVHDPSVIKVDETYYVFGSHLAAAKTDDLMNWESISSHVSEDNPLFENVFDELREAFDWAESDTLWATDVVELNGKFYMYYNACKGDSPRSALGIAVADDIEGPYKDEGIFLKSGMWDELSEDGTIYDANIHPNVIDPHVFFDANGKLWMVYGSYSGGIFILEMDENTGLPLENQGYGTKLMGGNHSRIEAPYIQYIPETGYYYLYVTFGGLDATGGYNMRVARSENPEGPYVDAEGNDMTNVRGSDGSFFDDEAIEPYGVKLMGNYLFERNLGEAGTGIGTGYVSPGHNSVYYDEQTKEQFLIFHTRFPERGEQHEIRVHQMFMNEDGWPVVAPYRYAEERLAIVSDADIIGEYKFINHGKEITADIKKPNIIQLEDNGTITGNLTGTWELKNDSEVTLNIDGNTYNGVFLQQWDPTSQSYLMTFTALSKEGISVWGSKHISKSDAEIVNAVKDELNLGDTNGVIKDLILPTSGGQGTTITWESSSPHTVTEEGVVNRPSVGSEHITVTLTATISKGSATDTKEFIITVLPESLSGLVAYYNFDEGFEDQSGQADPGTITGDKLDTTGGTITFENGKLGQAAVFDGSSGLRLPNGLISSNQYSVSLWVNPDEITDFSTTFFGATTPNSWISLVPSGPANGETMIWSGEEWYDANTGMTINADEWTHLAFTVNGGKIDVYINGVNKHLGEGFPNVFTTADASFSLGVNYWDIPFKGLMDELLIYDNFVLSEEEVRNYYDSGEIPEPEEQKIDVTSLEKLVAQAKEIENNNNYTENSYQALQNAIKTAELVLDTIESEKDLNDAIAALQTAIDGLEKLGVEKPDEDPKDEKPGVIDVKPLKELIAQAKGIENNNNYTENSYQALQNAIEVAELALDTIDSEKDLDNAIAALQKAIDGLDKQVVEDREDYNNSDVNEDDSVEIIDDEGESLPKTATFMYTILLTGFILLMIGGATLYIIKIRRVKE